MAVYLRVKGAAGATQIDDGYRNYGFQSKQSAVISVNAPATTPPGYNGLPYQMTASGTDVLIACRTVTLLPVLMHTYASGGVWTYNWLFLPPFTGATYTETVVFYVFDMMTGPFGNVGLRVKKPTGEIIFHSDARPMIVPNILGCDVGFTGDPGRIYAPLFTESPVYGVNMGPGFGLRLFAHCLYSSGSNIIAAGGYQLGAFGASAAYSNVGQYAAVDVTGL